MASMLDAQRSGIGGLAKLSEGVRANPDAKTQAGLSRGPNQSKKLINAAWTQTFPAQGATLDLDFVNDRGFVRGVGQGRSMDAVTFTRLSSGTFVGSDGLLKQYSNMGALGNNLFTFPQDFDNTAWAKNGVYLFNSGSIVNATAAPDGTITADLVVESDAVSSHSINQSYSGFVAGQSYCFSVYAKHNGRFLQLVLPTAVLADNYATFNLVEGIVTASGGVGLIPDITPAGDGWWRCSIAVTSTGTATGTPSLFLANAGNAVRLVSYGGDKTSGVFLWGAQLEVGTSPTEYFPTNFNQPRFDWASTALLANKNLANNTENITNNAGTNIVFNATTSPDGFVTAEKIIPTSGAATTHYANGGYIIPASGIYTISCYAKKEEYTGFRMMLVNAAGRYIYYRFDVNTGTYTGASIASTVPTLIGTPTVDNVGSGWYRCRVTIDNNSTGFSYNFYLGATSDSTIDLRDYSGDGTSGLYVWGTQVELGDTLTSYQAVAQPTTNTPLLANPTSNGLLIEISRVNQLRWCRDATQVGTNLVQYSEQFDNVFWSRTGILAFGSGSVANTTDTTAPNGTSTADLIVETSLNDFHNISGTGVTIVVGGVYVASIYVKRPAVNGSRYFQITFAQAGFGPSQYATFDLQTGLVSGYAGTVGIPVMTLIGATGWYRCSIAATAIATISSLVFFVLTNAATGRSPSYLGNGSGVYIWGAQVEEILLTDYVATTNSATTGWRKLGVTVAKNQTGIDGVANACTRLTATSANGICLQTVNLVLGSRTASVYLKRITGTGNIQVTLDGTTYSTVDLSTTEWRRIVLTGTLAIPAVGIRIVTSGDAVVMDFGQVEDGGFVTSPIMTTTQTATRAIDDVPLTTSLVGGWYNQMGGTAFADVEFRCFDGGGTTALPVLGFGHPTNNALFSTLITASGRRLLEIPTLDERSLTYSTRLWVASISFDFRINRCDATQAGIVRNVNTDTGNIANTTQYALARIFGTARVGGGTNLTGTIKRLIYTPELSTINSLINLST